MARGKRRRSLQSTPLHYHHQNRNRLLRHAPHASAHGTWEEAAQLAEVDHEGGVHEGLELGTRQAQHLAKQHLTQQRLVGIGQGQACMGRGEWMGVGWVDRAEGSSSSGS